MNIADYIKKLYARAGKQVAAPAHALNNDSESPSTPTIRTDLYELADRIRRMSQDNEIHPK